MQTWLALPDGKEEIDPAFEHVAKEDLPLVEDTGVSARVIMGSLWGSTSPITQHAATIYADILMNAGASIPIEAAADERRSAGRRVGKEWVRTCISRWSPYSSINNYHTSNI